MAISALTSSIASAFGIALSEVNLAVSISAAVFFPAFIVSTLLYNVTSLKNVLSVASGLMLIGAWIRVFSMLNNNFWWIVVGQSIIAAAGPMVTSSISIIANLWFADNERSTATSIMSLSNPIGSFSSLFIQGIYSAVTIKKIKNLD